MPITALDIHKVGIFEKIHFDFDPQINVFVGPNNSGKTTALFTLADITVQPFGFPRKHIRTGSKFSVEYTYNSRKRGSIDGPLPIAVEKKGYWTAEKARPLLTVQKQLGFRMFIPALRLSTDYRSKGPSVKTQQQKDPLLQELLEKRGQRPELPEIEYSFIADKSIVQDLINLDYQAYREKKREIRKTIERIASVASGITQGFPITFAGVDADPEGLSPCFKTPDGRLPLGVLSQGTQGLLLWLTRFVIGYARHYDFPKNFDQAPGILIIDEIDAHLHPSWQRRILPQLVSAFPKLQIFCSTQSPLMLAGLSTGQVQLLKRVDTHKIEVSRNETDIHGWSADEIYSCFMGVEHPTDMKTNRQLNRLEELRAVREPTTEQEREMANLRIEVASLLQNPTICKTEAASNTELEAAAKQLIAASSQKRSRSRGKKVDARR